jgi:hypothetical protein
MGHPADRGSARRAGKLKFGRHESQREMLESLFSMMRQMEETIGKAGSESLDSSRLV